MMTQNIHLSPFLSQDENMLRWVAQAPGITHDATTLSSYRITHAFSNCATLYDVSSLIKTSFVG